MTKRPMTRPPQQSINFCEEELLRIGSYYVPANRGIGGGVAILANRLYVFPVVMSKNMKWDRIMTYITLAGAAGTKARLGVWRLGTNFYPGALLLSSAELAVDVPGTAEDAISLATPEGVYFLGIVSSGTPSVYTAYPCRVLGSDSSLTEYRSWQVAFAYGALPDPFPAGAALAGVGPAVGLRLLSISS